MITLFYETVPAFVDTWVECLSDFRRYCIAVEDDDRCDREIWYSISRYWYKKATDKNPNMGYLAHYFAILSKSFSIE